MKVLTDDNNVSSSKRLNATLSLPSVLHKANENKRANIGRIHSIPDETYTLRVRSLTDAEILIKVSNTSIVCPLLATPELTYSLDGTASILNSDKNANKQNPLIQVQNVEVNKSSGLLNTIYTTQTAVDPKISSLVPSIGYRHPSITEIMSAIFFMAGILLMFYLLHQN